MDLRLKTIFTLLIIFQLKHWLADFPLQGRYMLGKFKGGREWIGPLTAHCAVHAGFTLWIVTAFLVITKGVGFGLIAYKLAAFDFVAHFVMDRIKASPHLMGRWKALSANEMRSIMSYIPTLGKAEFSDVLRSNTLFWWALGIDQMWHHLTHYVIIWVMVTH